MKHFTLIFCLLFILSTPVEVLSATTDYPRKFSIDVSNDALVNIVNNIEKIINSAPSSKENKLTIESQDIDFYDRYYDVPELLLLKNNTQLYQRTFVNQYITSRKGKKKKTKDNILFINEQDIKLVFKEKKYNKVKELWGKHPLLGLIKRKERGLLAEKLNELTIKTPLRLKNILNLRSVGKKFIVKQNNLDVLSIEILSHDVESLESTIHYSSVHFSSHKKDGNLNIVKQISSDLGRHLIDSNQNSRLYLENRYSHAYSLLSDEVILLNFKIGHPAIVRLMYALVWFVFGSILIVIFFRKRILS